MQLSCKDIACIHTPLFNAMLCELSEAEHLHGPFASLHEGFAVLLEEVEEFWEEVRKKEEHRQYDTIVKELIQVAAVAMRLAMQS